MCASSTYLVRAQKDLSNFCFGFDSSLMSPLFCYIRTAEDSQHTSSAPVLAHCPLFRSTTTTLLHLHAWDGQSKKSSPPGSPLPDAGRRRRRRRTVRRGRHGRSQCYRLEATGQRAARRAGEEVVAVPGDGGPRGQRAAGAQLVGPPAQPLMPVSTACHPCCFLQPLLLVTVPLIRCFLAADCGFSVQAQEN